MKSKERKSRMLSVTIVSGFAFWQPFALRKSHARFWIIFEFRLARPRLRRPSSRNFPSPSNHRSPAFDARGAARSPGGEAVFVFVNGVEHRNNPSRGLTILTFSRKRRANHFEVRDPVLRRLSAATFC